MDYAALHPTMITAVTHRGAVTGRSIGNKQREPTAEQMQ